MGRENGRNGEKWGSERNDSRGRAGRKLQGGGGTRGEV